MSTPRTVGTPRRVLGAVAGGLVLLSAVAACGDDGDGGSGRGLPDVVGTRPPEAYRVVYAVTTPEGSGREVRIVQRPFVARVEERDASGTVVAERLSDLGVLVTIADDEATAVETAVAPALGDLRPERFADRLVEAGRLERGADGEVGGRPCRRTTQPDVVATDDAGQGTPTGTLEVNVSRCIDAVGIVLEERITSPGGRALRTKRALELQVGDDVDEVDLPDAPQLSPEEGGGSVVEREPDPGTTWSLRAPEGFDLVGTFAVRPATLGVSGAAGASIELLTTAWRRGPDVLILDQGASAGGATPFDPSTELEDLELDGIGTARLAMDLRIAEVRVRLPEGRFLRVAGTLPLDDLVAAARTLQPPAAVAR